MPNISPKTTSTPLTPKHRTRHDGLTVERQKRFLAVLQHTGCVTDACRVIGVSTTSAYRIRGQYAKFAAKWDKALLHARQGLEAIAYQRAVDGRETIIIRKGEEVERRITPSDSMLALLLKRSAPNPSACLPDDDVISRAEHEAGWHFDSETGEKTNRPKKISLREDFLNKLVVIRARHDAQEAQKKADEDAKKAGLLPPP
jgi:hypothetical protein